MGRLARSAGWVVAGMALLGWFGSTRDEPPKPANEPVNLIAPKPDRSVRPPAPSVPRAQPQESSVAVSETLYTTANVKLRADPDGSAPVLDTISKGTEVRAEGERNGWRSVVFARNRGWVSSRYLSRAKPTPSPRPPPAAAKPPPKESKRGQPVRSPYIGTCDCPYDRMRNGRRCGGNSAYSRPGGRNPICYF